MSERGLSTSLCQKWSQCTDAIRTRPFTTPSGKTVPINTGVHDRDANASSHGGVLTQRTTCTCVPGRPELTEGQALCAVAQSINVRDRQSPRPEGGLLPPAWPRPFHLRPWLYSRRLGFFQLPQPVNMRCERGHQNSSWCWAPRVSLGWSGQCGSEPHTAFGGPLLSSRGFSHRPSSSSGASLPPSCRMPSASILLAPVASGG